LEELCYTYKLKELMPFDALHRFCSVLQDVIYRISELSLRLQKELGAKELELSDPYVMDTGTIEEPAALGKVMHVELSSASEGTETHIGNLVRSFLVYENEESKNYITLENSFYPKNPVRMVFDGSLPSSSSQNTVVENGLDTCDKKKTDIKEEETSNSNTSTTNLVLIYYNRSIIEMYNNLTIIIITSTVCFRFRNNHNLKTISMETFLPTFTSVTDVP